MILHFKSPMFFRTNFKYQYRWSENSTVNPRPFFDNFEHSGLFSFDFDSGDLDIEHEWLFNASSMFVDFYETSGKKSERTEMANSTINYSTSMQTADFVNKNLTKNTTINLDIINETWNKLITQKSPGIAKTTKGYSSSVQTAQQGTENHSNFVQTTSFTDKNFAKNSTSYSAFMKTADFIGTSSTKNSTIDITILHQVFLNKHY